jgi:hypothetical protein
MEKRSMDGDSNVELQIVGNEVRTGDAGQPVPDPVAVDVLRDGQLAAGVPVEFHVAAGDGQIGDTAGPLGKIYVTATGQNGRATLPVWVLGQRIRQRVVARAGAPARVAASFQASLNLALRKLSGDQQQTRVSTRLPRPLVVLLTSSSRPIQGAQVTFQVHSGNGQIGERKVLLDGTLVPLGDTWETRTGRDGKATLPMWELERREGRYHVTATIDRPLESDSISVTFDATAYLIAPLPPFETFPFEADQPAQQDDTGIQGGTDDRG